MNKPLLFCFGIVMTLAASSQTSSQTQTPPVSSTTPANEVGSGAQTKAGTPAPSTTNSTGQVNPTGTAQPPAPTANPSVPPSGGVAGAASSSATQSPSVDNSSSGIAAVTDSDLEGQIQNALNKEPTLTGDNPHVSVSSEAIELAGNVGTSKERITATRIVQSYAGSKKVVNHLTVGGKASQRAPKEAAPDRNRPDSSKDNPEPNKVNEPTASQPPPR